MKPPLTAVFATMLVLAAHGAKSADAQGAANGAPAAAQSGSDVQIDLSDMPHQKADAGNSTLPGS